MQSLLLAALAAAASAGPLLRRDIPANVPPYVIDYAPVVYLFTEETYFPSDLGAQLQNTHPDLNYSAITNGPNPLTLDNLDQLNSLGGKNVYLTSNDDITTNPAWLNGVVPDSSGKTESAVSTAIITTDHLDGTLDAFYMYFYAYNWGGDYAGAFVDDHVGDWEHTMVRFVNGVPTAMWFSQHANGEAFTYDAVEKYNSGVRPVAYSANGSHANYAIAGTHDHTIPNLNLPLGPVMDYCDNGAFWDPTLSAYYAKYDNVSNSFTAYDDSTPIAWLSFIGHWGDEAYNSSNPHYSDPFNISLLERYTSGPTGPEDKQLYRTNVCPDNGNACIVRPIIDFK